MPGIPEELASLRTSDEVLVVVDVGGNILLLSEPAEEFFGIGLDDVAGEAMELLMPEEFRFGHQAYRRAFFMEPVARQMDPGLEPAAERPLDGERIPIAVQLDPREIDAVRYAVAHVTRR
ncbi:MAG TPA: PAS domain S-box protein [Solirubrobacteraceae bacterium]|jgi:PAS domain S-box-containing protein